VCVDYSLKLLSSPSQVNLQHSPKQSVALQEPPDEGHSSADRGQELILV